MHLLLRRSQRDDGWVWTSMVFILDARLELSIDAQERFEKYKLRDVVVYNSDAYQQNAHAALEHYETSTKPAIKDQSSYFDATLADLGTAFYNIGASLYHTLAGVSYEVAAMSSLQITLGGLIEGLHLESESLEEIMMVSNTIRGAVEYLSNYLEIALTFDGRDELSEY